MTNLKLLLGGATTIAAAFALAACGGGDGGDGGESGGDGAIALSANFTPDPTIRDVPAGGSDLASDALAEASIFEDGPCSAGYISLEPSAVINYEAGDSPLYISAFTEDGTDTTLVIQGPDGVYYCDDDGAGFPNPGIEFANPQSGEYAVHIGLFREPVEDAEPTTASIRISETGFGEG